MKHSWLDPDELNFESKTEFLLYLRHLKAYQIAENICKDKKVLEVGGGGGYGTKKIGKVSKELKCIDIDIEAIREARRKNENRDVEFLLANPVNGLPFKENYFDESLSFQVIEHVKPERTVKFLEEIKRVLRPNGTLILTTPNRNLRLLPLQRPWNPYHEKEYYHKELKNLLDEVFPKVEVYGLRARKDIEKIEKKRVKQNPIEVYFKKPISERLKQMFGGDFLPNIKKQRETQKTNKNNLKNYCGIKKYSLTDFYIGRNNIGSRALDFFAICKNNGGK